MIWNSLSDGCEMKRLAVRPIPLFGMINRYQKPKMTYLLNFEETLEVYTYVWLIEGLEKKVLVDAGGTIEMAMTFGGRKKEEVVHIQSLEVGCWFSLFIKKSQL